MAIQMLLLCGHCGNTGKLLVVHELVDSSGGDYNYAWRLLQCPVCLMPTLYEKRTSLWSDSFEDPVDTRILYPPPRKQLESLPEDVDRAYQAALKVKNIEPNACAVLVGRTLEVICKYEGAQGRTLANKLEYLANSGRIPVTLARMAEKLRLLRNLGAHADEGEVEPSDIPFILDFVEAILEYLYVAPVKIANVERRINRQENEDWNLIEINDHPF